MTGSPADTPETPPAASTTPEAAPAQPATPQPAAATPPKPKRKIVAPKARGKASIRGRFKAEAFKSPIKTVQASPAYAFAMFLHLLLLVGLSFWTIATHLDREPRSVDVKLARQKEVVPVTAGMDREEVALDALMDASDRDLQTVSESDTDDPFHEARGEKAGEINVFGVGKQGGGTGRGRGGSANNSGGASKSSKGAMKAGLDWLARHRNSSGVWPANASHRPGKRLSGPGNTARTGLALLCFVSAGYGPDHEHRYSDVVKKAGIWLVKQVDKKGKFATSGGANARWYHNYEQAIGTLALAECLSRRDTPKLRKAVERAVGYIGRHQSPSAGWRYGRGDTDTSVTSWMVLALKSAEHAGVPVPSRCYEGVHNWLERVSNPNSGTTGYTTRGNPNPAMNATGLFLRITLGESPRSAQNRRAARIVSRTRLQGAGGRVNNFYGIYYSALAMYQVGGEQWRAFNPKIRDAVVSSQRKGSGCERGSWRPGGHTRDPVLATCFGTLTLETYFRYMPVHEGFEEEEIEEPEKEKPPEVSPGEGLLDVATICMQDARATPDDGGALLAAEAAYTRALRELRKENAKWSLTGEAQARLVELAMLAKDRELTFQRIDEYMREVPAGKTPDPAVVRLRRLERFNEAMILTQKAWKKGATDAQRAAAADELKAVRKLLIHDKPMLEPSSDEAEECDRLLAQADDALTRLTYSVDPDKAIQEGLAALRGKPARGKVEPAERRLLVALLLRAQEGFAVALEKKVQGPFDDAQRDLDQFVARRPVLRLHKDDLGQLQGLMERLYLTRAGALMALGKPRRAADAITDFRRRFRKTALAKQVDSIQRGALATLVRAGKATPADRALLADLIAKWTEAKTDLPPEEALALGDLLLAAGNLDAAGKHYLRCVTQGAQMQIENNARLGLAHISRKRGEFDVALDHLEAIRGQGRDRLDVNLERCRIWRKQGHAQQALDEYHKILRALDRQQQAEAWYTIAAAIPQAYLEAGKVKDAKTFLEYVRRQDRTFGGDEPRRKRFIALMRDLDRR